MASPKINAQHQRKIEMIIAKWTGKLTMNALLEKIELDLNLKVTRPTLYEYNGITNAFHKRKIQLKGVTPEIEKKITASEVDLFKQNKSLKDEIQYLENKNAEQLRMIERMLSNASEILNLDLNKLIKRRPEENR
jgi:C-terminal processing protease CtpA/Prc